MQRCWRREGHGSSQQGGKKGGEKVMKIPNKERKKREVKIMRINIKEWKSMKGTVK